MGTPIGVAILEWSKDRPAWQRDALRRLFVQDVVTQKDISELSAICKAAHGLHDSVPSEPLTNFHLAAQVGATEVTTLVSITHHQGVNSLAAEQTVSFGPQLTVVYGQNAAGKSGYTRILKRACRSRSTEVILGDVLSGKAPPKAEATIAYREGNADRTFKWSSAQEAPLALSAVSVFDAHSAPVYLKDRTDVAFRPFGLDIFDKLSTVCTEVRDVLETERSKLQGAAAVLPQFPEGTKVRNLVSGINSLTKADVVRTTATLSDSEKARLQALRNQQRDLLAADPARLARELSLRAERIESLVRHLSSVSARLGASQLTVLRTAIDSRRVAKVTLAKLHKATMTLDLLPGTGDVVWRRMWTAAEEFAHIAQPDAVFPVTGDKARCLLCQQHLDEEGSSHLLHFAQFVTSTAQQDADHATAAFEDALQSMTSTVIDREDIANTIMELEEENPTLGQSVSVFLRDAADIRKEIADCGANDAPLPSTALPSFEVSDLTTLAASLRSRATELQQAKPIMKAEATLDLKELEARELLGQHVALVLGEVERKQRLAAYTQCIDDTSTAMITRKSTEMTKELVTDSLQKTFQSELKKLEFNHLSIEIQPDGGTKGALFHRLEFSSAPGTTVIDVLSEGEARTLSLAAFLTELKTAPSKSAIIFDDPVSSLDHVWRERIAKRLVAEAKERQVIVFTHDLLFLRYLLVETDREGVERAHQYIRREGQAGICSPDLPWIAMGTKQRIGVLRNRWQAADKIFRTQGLHEFEAVAPELYRLLRQAWEHAIGEVLLNDVIERYRHSIETQKVRSLHDITQSDCDIVEQEMSECSRWMHDEPAADGTPMPGPEALKKRIDLLEGWVAVIRQRR